MVVAAFAVILFAGCKHNSDSDSGSNGGFKFTLPEPVGENPFLGLECNYSRENKTLKFDAEDRMFTCSGKTKYKYSYNTDEKLLYIECDSADFYKILGVPELTGFRSKEEILKYFNDMFNNMTDDDYYVLIQENIDETYTDDEKQEFLTALGYAGFEWDNDDFKDKVLDLLLDEFKEYSLLELRYFEQIISGKGTYSYELTEQSLQLTPFLKREIKLPEVTQIYNQDFAKFDIELETVKPGEDDLYYVDFGLISESYKQLIKVYATDVDYNNDNEVIYEIKSINDSEIIVTDKDGNSKTFTYTSEYDETTFITTFTITFDDGKKVKVSGGGESSKNYVFVKK